jgi:YidC/Oxa1 family membrane protein insertase
MDKQRLFLMTSLFLVAYLLILAWNKDYGQENAIKNTPKNEAAQINKATQKDIPQVVNTSTTTKNITTKDIPSAATTTAPEKKNNTIEVKTDTLNVTIDLHGGDIVRVTLPKYPKQKLTPNNPFVLLNDTQGVYIAQSGLIGLNGPDANPEGRPTYTSDAPLFELKNDQQTLTINLKLAQKDTNITKQFVFKRGDYLVDVNYLIENNTALVWQGALFGQIKRDDSKDPSSTSATHISTYVGAAFKTNNELYKTVNFKKIKEDGFKEDVKGGWVAMLQHYFVSAWIPNANETNSFDTRYQQDGPYYIAGFTGPLVNIAPKTTGTISAHFYVGPKIQSILRQISPGLELTVDYGVLWWLAQPIFWLMTHIQKIIGNWGFTIILLTFIVKLSLFKLSAAGYRSMAKMRKVAPELARLKETYGDDKPKMSQAMMELYKKEKINPLGGCLPILIQMPVFLALYWTLLESVELRQAPFILWITDLSAKDPYFILPLLMGASMFIQQQLSPAPPDPVQARVMKLMPVMMTFFFLWFPSGLVLYWVVSNMLSILQQWVITRQIESTT